MWIVFALVVSVVLFIDSRKSDHVIGAKESLISSFIYIAIALLFAVFIWYELGTQSAHEYLTAYAIEKSLSLDNIFVIAAVLTYFEIPAKSQHRVLFWGIVGVLILRGIMIYLGAKLVVQYDWVLYIFSVLLIITGIKMLFIGKHETDLRQNKLLNFLQRHLPVTNKLFGTDFVVKEKGKLYITPMLLALIVIELMDAVFAIDSVPAIFTITTDPYVVYTSNIFAILGLRALYFALAAIKNKFQYLSHALALVLIFIGGKIFVAPLIGIEHIPTSISLGVTFGLILSGILLSAIKVK
jgi:tellurite resistance protein TerC